MTHTQKIWYFFIDLFWAFLIQTHLKIHIMIPWRTGPYAVIEPWLISPLKSFFENWFPSSVYIHLTNSENRITFALIFFGGVLVVCLLFAQLCRYLIHYRIKNYGPTPLTYYSFISFNVFQIAFALTTGNKHGLGIGLLLLWLVMLACIYLLWFYVRELIEPGILRPHVFPIERQREYFGWNRKHDKKRIKNG